MDKDKDFLERQLTAAKCQQYLDIFLKNEIDKDCFIKLTRDDLRILIPGKLGPQKAIMEQIQQLQGKSPNNLTQAAQSDPIPSKPNSNAKILLGSEYFAKKLGIPPPKNDTHPLQKEAKLGSMSEGQQMEEKIQKLQEKSANNLTQAAQPHKSGPNSNSKILLGSELFTKKLGTLAAKNDSNPVHKQMDPIQPLRYNRLTLAAESDPTLPKSNSKSNKQNKIPLPAPVPPKSSTVKPSAEPRSEFFAQNFGISAPKNDPHPQQPTGEGQQILEQLRAKTAQLSLNPQSSSSTITKVDLNDGEGTNSTFQELLKYRKNLEAVHQEHLAAAEADKLAAVMTPKQLFNPGNVSKAIKDHVKTLPIFAYRDKLIKAVRDNQMVIVVGETGSGKSTQIPKYLLEAGYSGTGRIGVTQPRRVATKALAKRVSIECGTELGEIVGYVVRFDKRVSGDTVVKYMTDGILLKELGQEPDLDSYSVIIVDEAHERSIHTDVCFGLLKQAASRRPDLKIIVSSATLDSGKFSAFFNNAPVFNIPGKIHPVEVIYSPKSDSDYIQGTVDTVLQIHRTQPPGDVLVFLSGQDEIESSWDSLARHPGDDLLIVPCYGALPLEDQERIFDPTPKGCRKIVLATNIAETSLTVDGIVYVVDSGRFKQNEYNPKTGIDSLVVQMITKAQATQRMGRAGRTRPGQTYRLYSEAQYQRFKSCGVPEIQRSNVESVILQLSAMGVVDVLKFDFMDPPNREAVLEALEHLQELEALDNFMRLTALGRRMSEFPLDPPLSKVLITSAELGCSSEMLSIVALMSIQFQSLFSRGRKCYAISDSKKSLFNHPDGDHLSLLKLYNTWVKSGRSQDWCRDNYVQYRLLADAEDIRIQLTDIMHSHRLSIVSCGLATTNIRKAICSGFFRRLAMGQPTGYHYHTFTNPTQPIREAVFIHPASALFSIQPKPQWVIYHEVVKTKKAYMRAVAIIEPTWLKKYAPTFFKKLLRYPEISGLKL